MIERSTRCSHCLHKSKKAAWIDWRGGRPSRAASTPNLRPAHDRPRRSSIRADNLQRQAHQFVCAGLNPPEVEPLDDPDACFEQRLVRLPAVDFQAAYRQVVDADRPDTPRRQILRRVLLNIDAVLSKFFGMPRTI